MNERKEKKRKKRKKSMQRTYITGTGWERKENAETMQSACMNDEKEESKRKVNEEERKQ